MEGITVTHRVVEEVMRLLPKATWETAVAWCDAHLPHWRLNLEHSVEKIECFVSEEDEE